MTWTLTDYQNRVRGHLNDAETSNRVIEEQTNALVGGNGSKSVFTLSRTNLVTSQGVQFSLNGAAYDVAGLTIDYDNGIATFSAPPSLSTSVPSSLFFLYYFQHFTDDQITPMIDYGLQKVGKVSSGTGNDFSTLSDALFNVVCLYAASSGYMELSSRYSRMVNISGDGVSADKSKITEQYLKLSQEYETRAEKERLSVYGQRQDRSTAVASAFKSITPDSSRWGVSR